MTPFLAFILVVVGFVSLAFGADRLVKGASSLASRFGVPPLIVGLTIVAYGTSAPELAATLAAALRGSSALALGNVVGSNIANIGLIVGVAAAVRAIKISPSIVRREYPLLLIATLAVVFMAYDGTLGRVEGVVLLISGFGFTAYQVFKGNKNREKNPENIDKCMSLSAAVLWTIGGAVFLIGGADAMVRGAVFIARWLGVSEWVIGITIVALGTSLPELATCVAAGLHGEDDLSLGNIVGSNIFNLVWVLGVASAVSPINIKASGLSGIRNGLLLMMIFTLLLFLMIRTGTKVFRWQGWLFFMLYLGAVIFMYGGVV